MLKLVDELDLGSSAEGRVGSSPTRGTKKIYLHSNIFCAIFVANKIN